MTNLWSSLVRKIVRCAPNPKPFKADAEGIFAEIGYALTMWSHVESYLVLILSVLLKADPERVGVVMYYNMNLSSWFNIISELLSSEPGIKAFSSRWNNGVSELRRLKDLRDRLAHHVVSAGTAEPLIVRPRLDLRTKSSRHGPLTIQEVQRFGSDLDKCVLKLREFMKELSATSP